eukprot:SAG11_NODE_8533_length_1004_cov_1.901657_1_plen_51_part_10
MVQIGMVSVRRGFQRRGIGRALVGHCEATARREGRRTIEVLPNLQFFEYFS